MFGLRSAVEGVPRDVIPVVVVVVQVVVVAVEATPVAGGPAEF